MKWEHAKKDLDRDPWLKNILFYNQSGNVLVDEKVQKSILDCNVTHIMFRGDVSHLPINSRPEERSLSISSAPHYGAPEGCDVFNDNLGYYIGYYLVVKAYEPEQIIVKHLSTVSDRYGVPPCLKSIRWASVELENKLRNRPHKWIAIVRNPQIISQGEYLMNGFDVFKCYPGFTPHQAGWHRTGYQKMPFAPAV